MEPWEAPERHGLVRDLISAAFSWAICNAGDKNSMSSEEKNLLDAVLALNKSVP